MPESNKNDARKRLSNAKNVSRGGTDPLRGAWETFLIIFAMDCTNSVRDIY
jgi:hypothetical protein